MPAGMSGNGVCMVMLSDQQPWADNEELAQLGFGASKNSPLLPSNCTQHLGSVTGHLDGAC